MPLMVAGTVAGTIAELTDEYALVPTPLTAATLNVYEVPLVRPVTVALVADEAVCAKVDHEVPPLLEY